MAKVFYKKQDNNYHIIPIQARLRMKADKYTDWWFTYTGEEFYANDGIYMDSFTGDIKCVIEYMKVAFDMITQKSKIFESIIVQIYTKDIKYDLKIPNWFDFENTVIKWKDLEDALTKHLQFLIDNHKNCVICGKQTTLKCSKCNVVYYCGVDHQKEDWKNHKNNH